MRDVCGLNQVVGVGALIRSGAERRRRRRHLAAVARHHATQGGGRRTHRRGARRRDRGQDRVGSRGRLVRRQGAEKLVPQGRDVGVVDRVRTVEVVCESCRPTPPLTSGSAMTSITTCSGFQPLAGFDSRNVRHEATWSSMLDCRCSSVENRAWIRARSGSPFGSRIGWRRCIMTHPLSPPPATRSPSPGLRPRPERRGQPSPAWP